MSKKSFRAKIETQGPGGAWSLMHIPFDVEKEWGSRARVSVCGKMDGFAFRTSIFPDGKGGHTMMVNKAMMQGAKAGQGDTVRMELAQDTAPRIVTIPSDVKNALAGNSKAKANFNSFAPSHRKAYVVWITGAKRAETRASRIAKAVVMIAAGKKPDW
jgi:hypothetical protein